MSLITVLQSLNGAQFLNATCVAAVIGCFSFFFFSTAGLALGLAAIVLVTAIFPVTKIYA